MSFNGTSLEYFQQVHVQQMVNHWEKHRIYIAENLVYLGWNILDRILPLGLMSTQRICSSILEKKTFPYFKFSTDKYSNGYSFCFQTTSNKFQSFLSKNSITIFRVHRHHRFTFHNEVLCHVRDNLINEIQSKNNRKTNIVLLESC